MVANNNGRKDNGVRVSTGRHRHGLQFHDATVRASRGSVRDGEVINPLHNSKL